MAARRRSPAAEKDLGERQHFWLKHLRAAKRKDEPLNGALLEWSEAPQGDSLRELIGLVS